MTPAGRPVPCNFCGKDHADPVAFENGFRIVRCRGCGLVYVSPRPAPEELASLYARYHVRHHDGEGSWDILMSRVFREAARLFQATRNGNGPGRLLDVGCGFGGFVALMRLRGWDAEGIDPSPPVVASARRKGLPVRRETFEALDERNGPFDGISLFYVLEHLADPMGAMTKAHGLLAPGGMLLLRVPHTTPIVRLLSPFRLGGRLYDPPFHMYDFPPDVLGKMLREAGFRDVRTFPGEPTLPPGKGPRAAAVGFGAAARLLYAATGGAILLPGVSKTTIAFRR